MRPLWGGCGTGPGTTRIVVPGPEYSCANVAAGCRADGRAEGAAARRTRAGQSTSTQTEPMGSISSSHWRPSPRTVVVTAS